MGNYKFILFDADDTILDFTKTEEVALKKVFNKYNIDFNDKNVKIYKSINSKLWTQFEKGEIKKTDITDNRFKFLFKKLAMDGYHDSVKEDYQDYLGEGYFVIDGAEDILKKLSEDYSLYCVTNGIYKTQKSRFEGSGLCKYFKEIFISEQIGYQKPMKEYFDYVESKIPGFNRREALIVGDSLSSDIKGGNLSNIDTCFYNPNDYENNSDVEPTYEIRELNEILKILNQ